MLKIVCTNVIRATNVIRSCLRLDMNFPSNGQRPRFNPLNSRPFGLSNTAGDCSREDAFNHDFFRYMHIKSGSFWQQFQMNQRQAYPNFSNYLPPAVFSSSTNLPMNQESSKLFNVFQEIQNERHNSQEVFDIVDQERTHVVETVVTDAVEDVICVDSPLARVTAHSVRTAINDEVGMCSTVPKHPSPMLIDFSLEDGEVQSSSSSSAKSTPANMFIAATIAAEDEVEILQETVSSVAPLLGSRPMVRKWESASPVLQTDELARTRIRSTNAAAFQFSLLTYNILCQQTIGDTMYLYTDVNPTHLEWQFRWAGLAAEFKRLNTDILCLQEVQADHYELEMRPFMLSLGFDGVFKKRTGVKPDGCATFYRKSKFVLDAQQDVEYFFDGTFCDRDNIGLITVLKAVVPARESKAPPKLVVANTHLLFNPRRGDIKLAQLALLFAHIEKIAYRQDAVPGTTDQYLPVILCGDFNSVPYSPLYKLVVCGSLRYEGTTTCDISGQGKRGGHYLPAQNFIIPQFGITDDCQFIEQARVRPPGVVGQSRVRSCETEFMQNEVPKGPPLNTGVLMHPFEFLSVYSHLANDGQPEVTTYHSREHEAVDYIFYTVRWKKLKWLNGNMQYAIRNVREGPLRLLERYSLVSRGHMDASVGKLPNALCSSDHLPLAAKFELAV